MKQVTSLLALSLVFATGVVVAADPPKTASQPATPVMDHGKMDMQHEQMDHSKMNHGTDHHMANDEFATLDKNKDGKVSKAEIPAKHPLAAHFSMLDANKDGSLSQAEFAKHHGM